MCSRRSSITGWRHRITNKKQENKDCRVNFARAEKRRKDHLDLTKTICRQVSVKADFAQKSYIIIYNARDENTQGACSVLQHCAVATEPFLAAVNQRCGLNLAMVTLWKKLGEAGILV